MKSRTNKLLTTMMSPQESTQQASAEFVDVPVGNKETTSAKAGTIMPAWHDCDSIIVPYLVLQATTRIFLNRNNGASSPPSGLT